MYKQDIEEQHMIQDEDDDQISSDQDINQCDKQQNGGVNRNDMIIIAIIVCIAMVSIIGIVIIGQQYYKKRDNSTQTKILNKEQQKDKEKIDVNNYSRVFKGENLTLKNRQKQLQQLHKLQDLQILEKSGLKEKLMLRQMKIPNQKTNIQNFIWQNLQNGNMLWYKHDELRCESDLLINSALRMGQNLYLQKTAYEDINIFYQMVDIPAKNIYQFEPIRQFLSNATKTRPQYVIAFDHPNPLLLIIATSMSKSKGIFINKQIYWPLFQQNLMLNDVLPLANPVTKAQITRKEGYNILITNDQKAIKEILFYQKRQVFVVLHLTQPKQLETFVLRKMSVYRFLEGQECKVREMQVYEQTAWRVDDLAWILPDIYIVTLNYIDLPLHLQHKNYQRQLYNYRKLQCTKTADFKPQSQELNQHYLIKKLQFKNLFLMKQKSDVQIDKNSHTEILIYFKQFPAKGEIYLQSGSYYLFLLICYASGQKADIYLNPAYAEVEMLNKNLVLNNLENVKAFDKSKESHTFSLIVTKELTLVYNLSFLRILLVVQKKTPIDLKKFRVSKFTESSQCQKTSLDQVATKELEPGVYLIAKH